ncbi:MAG: class I SAM-dependent methyltransferase [Hyphomicrobiaceae bacterium]
MADWDAKYAGRSTGLFGDEPNEYLRQIVARSEFAASSALCLADGDGRNGRWLAARGLDVTAVDISEIAAANAAAFDRQTGLAVERVVADLANWAPPDGRVWDAVFLFYLQCDAPTRLRALKLASQALARNGWFVLEAFAKSQADNNMGPADPSLLYSLDEFGEALPEFEIVEALDGQVRLDEGPRHTGLAQVVRYAARKV